VDDGVARWRRVAYDVGATQRKIRRAGLPEVLADRLTLGR
jgi:diadenosine tetraphosphatase ApaH/serine/threonine PP2A family protein phosphatase